MYTIFVYFSGDSVPGNDIAIVKFAYFAELVFSQKPT